jgi:pyruvate dehydrogenase E1 component alpha subunit
VRIASKPLALSSTFGLRLARGFASDTATFTVERPFKGHKLSPPDAKLTTTKKEMLEFYKVMSFYRRVEIVADTNYKSKLIRGFLHLYDGQEACVVGMEAAIKRTDSLITAYRDHCHQLSRGDTAFSVFAELYGKQAGCSKGKGGSMHFYYPENGFYGGNGIVGAQVPVGVGLAFAHKYKGDNGLSVSLFGDGAANQGQIFEAANMAALWKLPAIFVCENNQYGMGTSIARASASVDFYTRGDYVPGLWVDGMDVLAVKKAFEFGAECCRSGKGPLFFELNTYRYHGHSMSDPGVSYRSREEVQAMREKRDCIGLVKKRILELKWATEEELREIDDANKVEVEKASKDAQAAPLPTLDQTFVDIYRGAQPPFIRGTDPVDSVNNGVKYVPYGH